MGDGASRHEVIGARELRRRLPRHHATPRQGKVVQSLKEVVSTLNVREDESGKGESEKRTYGRTPDGTVFIVPHTHDMVSQLLSPTQPKNLSDLFVITILAGHVLALVLLHPSHRIPIFAILFLFWRACYNGGIGVLLKKQSNDKTLVSWARKSNLFVNPATGHNPHPMLYRILKREMETKIPRDYKFEDAPIEYNTWLTFRRVVDLVLMCDFTSYTLFAIACSRRPDGEHLAMTIARWAAGVVLVLFNLWVKLDAHRVVKDYAWYWGDFFYLIDQELTFDGVFEMAPHPMYSVGYAGYYGISLMAASYKVLFISIIAHAAQFVFLALVEEPHIDKTYNPPPPRKRAPVGEVQDDSGADLSEYDTVPDPSASTYDTLSQRSSPRALLGFKNFDLHRVTDIAAILIQAYFYSLVFFTPSTTLFQTLFVGNAVAWRLWYSIGIGYILDRQSRKKKWTRHFIKYGESTKEAWRQWKGIYHLSMIMCYVSFATAAFKMYTLPPDWTYGVVALRHIVGLALVALQIWTAFSVYQSLGEFGWFYGDFFFDHPPKLTYSGIYRFLNNPERVIGLAGLWGVAIITWSKAIFFTTLLSHILSLCFIQLIERPHMQRRYGEKLRQDSGVSKTFRRSLPPTLQQWQGNIDRIFEEVVDLVEEILESAKTRLAAGAYLIAKDYKTILHTYPARMSITRITPNLVGFDPRFYSLKFEGTLSSDLAAIDKASGREGKDAQGLTFIGREFQPVMLEYGAPIRVRWTAPLNHSKKDWVGLYMIADNVSRKVTRVTSQGRWIATCKGAYDSARAEQGVLVSDKQKIEWIEGQNQTLMTGEMEFTGDKLWWTTGVFEFRYHLDGKHTVMAISKPFETRIGRSDEDHLELQASGTIRAAIEQKLLPMVRNCFDRDPDIAPNTVEEPYGSLVERDGKFARRVVYAVGLMFGIEFAPEVVRADGNVRNLAWRICNAKQVLAPYSMSPTGTLTPTDAKD